MTKENIKLYRIISLLFLIFIGILVYVNLNVVKQIELNKKYKKPEVRILQTSIKTYGYSEALALLSKEPNINIISFNNDLENKKLLKVELYYNGNIEGLINVMKNLKEEDNYYCIDNIIIKNVNEDNQSVKLNLFLLKNK